MTLFRQLVIALTVLFTCLLAGNLFVSVYNARSYFYEQMQAHAEDTATFLGFTISRAAQQKDVAMLNSMIDVIFDRGYYRRITYLDLKGEAVVERERPIQIENVPSWFVSSVELPAPLGRAEVVSGWLQVGELVVEGHPGYAYRDLWRVLKEQLWLFAVSVGLSCALAGLGLRYLLHPLRKLETQAAAICRREFPLQKKLPRSRELRRVVEAMNRMVQKTRDMFQEQVALTESLHRQAYLDPVTGLSNRRDFDARFEAMIRSDLGGCPGLMVLVHIGNMQQFNDKCGRDAGDECLIDIARVLKHLTADTGKVILSRRSGADFCVFIPAAQSEEVESFVEKMYTSLRHLSWFDDSTLLHLYVGAAFSAAVTLGSHLLSEADTALRQARHRDPFGWCFYRRLGPDERALGAGQWRRLLESAIAERRLLLHYQPNVNRDGDILCMEVLCRLEVAGRLYPAGVFFPVAERFDLGGELDRLVLELLYEAHTDTVTRLCVNLSPRSIQQHSFLVWLQQTLQQHPEFATRLIFELPEQVLVTSPPAVRRLVDIVQPCGAGISLDHFGTAMSTFGYMQSIAFEMVKIDRCFIQSIHNNSDNQFLVKSLLQIAHSCDIKTMAEGVESAQEWQTLLELGIDGGQGFLLGRPDGEREEIN